MGELLIDNVESGISDEEVSELLQKYGFPAFDEIQHLPGDGSRPAVLLTFRNATPESLRILQPRIHDLFWKNRKIEVQVINERYS